MFVEYDAHRRSDKFKATVRSKKGTDLLVIICLSEIVVYQFGLIKSCV